MCKQEKETIQNIIMEYVKHHRECQNKENCTLFSFFSFNNNAHYITCTFLIHSTNDGNFGSIRLLAQRALHDMTGSGTVSIQEVAHEIDQLPLVLCSNIITYASITKSQELFSENNEPAKYTILMYRNCSPDRYSLSVGKYSYDVFCKQKNHEQEGQSQVQQQDDYTARS